MSEIFVKNLPLSFLKDKGNNFFDSEVLEKAIGVFEKYKHELKNDTAVSDVMNDILPLEELKSFLLSRSQYRRHKITSKEQSTDLVIIGLSGKLLSVPQRGAKVRKYLTADNKSITTPSAFRVTLVENHVLLNAERERRNLAKAQKKSLMKDFRTKPEKTNNVVKDITYTSKYYDSILSQTVYDDKAYMKENLRRSLISNIMQSSIYIPLSTIRRSVEDYLPIHNRDMMHRIEALIERLIDKYYNHAYTLPPNNNVYSEDLDNSSEMMKQKLLFLAKNYPISILRYIFLGESNISINHNVGRSNIRALIYDTKDGRLLDDNEYSFEIVDDNNININLNKKLNVEILLVYDIYHPSIRSLFTYRRKYSDDKIDIYALKGSSGYSADGTNFLYTIPVRNYNLGYGLVEVRTKKDKETIIPKSVYIDENYVKINLEYINEDIEVAILPTHKVVANLTTFEVNMDNYVDTLNTIKIFNNEVKAYKGLV